MNGTGPTPLAEDLLAQTASGWWFHHVDVVGQLIARGRADLALEAYRRLSDRWYEDPRGEEGPTRVLLVDLLTRLHPRPAVVEELRRQLEVGDQLVARRALHHLIRLEVVPAGAGTADHVPERVREHIAPVLHDLGMTDAARQHLAAAGSPTERQRWWFRSYDDVAALDVEELRRVAAGHAEWFVRSWAARALLARRRVDDGLAAYGPLFPIPASHARDRAAALEPEQAVRAIAAHLDRPAGQATMIAAAADDGLRVQRTAVDALVSRGRRLDVPGTIRALAARGPAGRVAALAVAARTGHDADTQALTAAVLDDVRTTRSSAPASALLSLDLPAAAAAAAAALISAADPATPVAHVGTAMQVLWRVGGPEAIAPIRRVADIGPGIPRQWRDHYLQKQAVHYLSLLERT